MCHKTELASVIRGHHVYMSVWSTAFGEKLFAAPDLREEAREYDNLQLDFIKKKMIKDFLSAMYHDTFRNTTT